jgi:ACS family hexuronate transporter-like MFS transporter
MNANEIDTNRSKEIDPGISTKRFRIPHLRWYIVALLCLASELNYMDRATLSVVKERMQKALDFDDSGYAFVSAIFLWVYAFAYLAVGWIVDRIGTRKSMLLFVTGWSIANMLHAFSGGVRSLAFFRGLLATMEPGSFPGGMRAVSEWFPMRERALATGIFIAGTSLGSTLAIPVADILAETFGWQYAFVATGLVGLVWVAAWYLVYQIPERHPRITETEREMILAGRENESTLQRVDFFKLISRRETWGCVSARVFTDWISYFLLFWGPSFVRTQGGFSADEFKTYAWMPFAAMMLGYLSSGVIPRVLISLGWNLSVARKTTTTIVSIGILMACQTMIRIDSPNWVFVLFTLICYGHGAWGNMTYPAEVYPKYAVGTVTGFGGFVGAIAGGFIQLWIGSLPGSNGMLTSTEYAIIFTACSVSYLIAIFLAHVLIGKLGVIREVEFAK